MRASGSPLYHALIAAFLLLSGVPMVLNTSFNLNKMPIVESPADALGCFLDADDDLSLLVLDGRLVRRRPFPARPAAARPLQQRAFVSRSLADPTGEPRRVEALVEDEWLPLTDALELEVLERCAGGDATVGELSAELAAETDGDVSEEDVVGRLRHLYRLRLVSFA